ncbi:MAG: hypothetical protein C0468_01200 [Planctomyces sp.]|nr:hypothetical protein [Planctomyces sp.]
MCLSAQACASAATEPAPGQAVRVEPLGAQPGVPAAQPEFPVTQPQAPAAEPLAQRPPAPDEPVTRAQGPAASPPSPGQRARRPRRDRGTLTNPERAGPAPAPDVFSEGLDPTARAFSTLGYRLSWSGASVTPADASVTWVGLAGPSVLVADNSGAVSALSVESGALRWAQQPDSPNSRVLGVVAFANLLGIVTEGTVTFYESGTGNLTPLGTDRTPRQRLARVASTEPLAIGNLLVYGTSDGFASAHRMDTGTSAWSYRVGATITANPVRSAPAQIVFSSDAGEVLNLDAGTGQAVGRFTAFGGPGAPLATSDRAIFVASLDQSLYALAPDGRVIWRLRNQKPLDQPPVFVDGRLYVTLPDKGLSLIEPDTGEIRWSNPMVSGEIISARGTDVIAWDGTTAWRIDRQSGDVLSSTALPGYTRLLTDKPVGGSIYAVTAQGRVSRFIPR